MCFVLYLVVFGPAAAETRGCVEWSTSSPFFFPSEESRKHPPLPVCRHRSQRGKGEEEDSSLSLTAACGDALEALRGVEGCDVWWRPVFDDVIPPMPELAVALTEESGACRRSGRVGRLGLSGPGFGKCAIGNETFDGGGFDLLQARRLRVESSTMRPASEEARRRIDSLLTNYFSRQDIDLFERVVAGTSFSEIRRELLALDNATLDAFLSPSRYVRHDLNRKGMHVARAIIAQNVRDARLDAYSSSNSDDLEEWKRDGILIRPYLGEGQLDELLNVVSAEPPTTFCANSSCEWIQRNVTSKPGEDDPQFLAHMDSFATVVKVWLFRAPLDARHGPLTFVKGSQRLDEPKLRWMHAYSQDEAALREPSFRLRGSHRAEAAAPDFVRRCLENASPVLPPVVAPRQKQQQPDQADLHSTNLTLVIADTSAIHFRARAHDGFVRVSYRLKGDNGGGLPRLDPFRPPPVGDGSLHTKTCLHSERIPDSDDDHADAAVC